jgi:ABC-type transport system substrate-binding protein
MNRLDRRFLFTSGAAAALLAASGLSLDAAPRPGGRLRLAVPRDDTSLDAAMRGAVFETLTGIAPDGTLHGELATNWRGSEDARVWTFDLRKGVTFHDGTGFTAKDAVASLIGRDVTRMPKLAGVEATGPNQIRLELALGDPDLPYVLADPTLVMRPAGRSGQALDDGIGTGLYRVVRWQPGRQFLGARVTQHHKDGRAGWLDSIEIVVIPDSAVRAEALRDGFVDVAAFPLPDGLRGRGDFIFRPSVNKIALAAHRGVGVPRSIGMHSALDDGRIAERWWMV